MSSGSGGDPDELLFNIVETPGRAAATETLNPAGAVADRVEQRSSHAKMSAATAIGLG